MKSISVLTLEYIYIPANSFLWLNDHFEIRNDWNEVFREYNGATVGLE